jgi:cob(I)alamin adenosyltransferase
MVGGGRIEKDSERMHAVGDVDELNAAVGVVEDSNLQQLQALLFELGAELANPNDQARITQTDIEKIESWIDRADQENEPLKSFILPGGCTSASQLHYARTVCRRAERSVTSLHRNNGCTTETLVALNRISDLLFALARQSNKQDGVTDISWTPKEKDST